MLGIGWPFHLLLKSAGEIKSNLFGYNLYTYSFAEYVCQIKIWIVLYCKHDVFLHLQACQNLGCNDTGSKCAVLVLLTGEDMSCSGKVSQEWQPYVYRLPYIGTLQVLLVITTSFTCCLFAFFDIIFVLVWILFW